MNKEKDNISKENKSKEIQPVNKQDDKKGNQDKKEKDKKEASPLWARVLVFMFSIMVAAVLLFSSFISKDIKQTACQERNAIKQDLIILQKRVESLERETAKTKIPSKNAVMDEVEDLSNAVFDKIDKLETQMSVILGDATDEIKNMDMEEVYNSQAFKEIESVIDDVAQVKNKVENLLSEREAIKEETAKLGSEVKSVVQRQAQGFKALLAFENLKDAVNSQVPYEAELSSLKDLLSDTAYINWDAVSRNASTGIPSVESLTQQFRKYAREAVATPEEDAGWWDKTVSNMSSVVTVRKTGYIEGNNPEAVLARAEQILIDNPTKEGVQAALNEISKLPPNKKKIFSSWIKDAQSIINTKETLENIRKYILLQGAK